MSTTTDPAPIDPIAALDAATVLDDAKPADSVAAGGAGDTIAAGGADDKTQDGDKSDDAKPLAGAPETYDLKMPEGATLDADAWKLAEPVFKDANLGPDQAQKLAAGFPKIAEAILARAQTQSLEQIATIRKEWATDAGKDPEIAGDANLATIAAGRDSVFGAMGESGKELGQLLRDTGLGSNKLVLRMFKTVGVQMQTGQMHRSDISSSPAPPEAKRYAPAFSGAPAA